MEAQTLVSFTRRYNHARQKPFEHMFSISFTVKSEIKSPATIVDTNGLSLASSHLDSTLFCGTPVNLDATQSSNAYDHKQDYYNYYK